MDHEISIEGLDVSLSKGASKLSPFFSVHIHPPNKVVNALLENQIKQLMNNLIVSQKKTANAKGDVCGVAPGNEHGEAGADDAVVKHIASILIKVIIHSVRIGRAFNALVAGFASVICNFMGAESM